MRLETRFCSSLSAGKPIMPLIKAENSVFPNSHGTSVDAHIFSTEGIEWRIKEFVQPAYLILN